jgi:ketosteroid isomerase-like protein
MDGSRWRDVFGIQQTKSRYFRYLDTKQWALWRELFTDDLVFYMEDSVLPATMEPVTVGGDKFVEYVSDILTSSVTVHQGHMPEIEFRGPDEADVVWAMYDWVDNAEQDHAMQGFGHYHETYRKGADGTWRIATLRLTRIRVDEVPTTRPSGERPWPPAWSRPSPA